MSEGMLGRLQLSAVRGPRYDLDALLAGPDGEEVLAQLRQFNRRRPCWVNGSNGAVGVEKLGLRVVQLGQFIANYDETIAVKLAAITDPAHIGARTEDATDEHFPDTRTGTKSWQASAVCFGRTMLQTDLVQWCTDNNKVLATPKDGIDLAKSSLHPLLDNVVPLVMAGQFFVAPERGSMALYFGRNAEERRLAITSSGVLGEWANHWWFLILEEIASAA